MLMKMKIAFKKAALNNIGDYALSITALGQSVLALLQIFFIDSGIMSEEKAGMFRVFFSVLFVLFSVPWIVYRKFLLLILVYFFFSFLFSFSVFQNSAVLEYVLSEGIRFTLSICLPIFLSLVSIRNWDIFYKVAFQISMFVAFIGLLYLILLLTGNLPMKANIYDMGLGYSLLIPALFLFWHKGKFGVFVALLLTILILLLGSRGPLLPIALFIFVQRLVLGSINEKFFLFILLIIIICSFNFVINLLQDYGINSRTLELLVEGEMDSDSGRGDIYLVIVNKISDCPIFGHGMFSDRVFLDGSYCHNILLELFMNFGYFIPIFFIIVMIFLICMCMKHSTKLELTLLLLFFLASIVPLLVSGSYLTDFRLPLFLGYLYVLLGKYLPMPLKKKNMYSVAKK